MSRPAAARGARSARAAGQHLAVRADEVPLATVEVLALTAGVTGLLVADVGVERVPAVGELGGAVGPLRGAGHRGVRGAGGLRRRAGDRRPVDGAGGIAVRG